MYCMPHKGLFLVLYNVKPSDLAGHLVPCILFNFLYGIELFLFLTELIPMAAGSSSAAAPAFGFLSARLGEADPCQLQHVAHTSLLHHQGCAIRGFHQDRRHPTAGVRRWHRQPGDRQEGRDPVPNPAHEKWVV
jgi:hypothetical protein